MPERKPIHESICRDLGIACFSVGKKCPLDENQEWHDLHHHSGRKRKYLIPFEGEFAIKITPDLDEDQCERFVMAHLKRLSNIVQGKWDLSEKCVRLCWTAHMVVDHASDYYWESRGKQLAEKSPPMKHWFRHFFKDDPSYRPFLLRIAKRVLDCDPLT